MGIGKNQVGKAFRRVKRPVSYYAIAAVLTLVLAAAILLERNRMDLNYTNLLNTIAQGESKGNYNAYFGNAGNNKIDFTAMTVGEVLEWQASYVAQGSPSSAVGKYQFINTTLKGLLNEMGVSHAERFDANLQDRLAIRLLERRGVQDYALGRISREQLAHNLSKEWAALPRVIGGNPDSSYYDGDGLNKAHVKVDQVMAAIASLKPLNNT